MSLNQDFAEIYDKWHNKKEELEEVILKILGHIPSITLDEQNPSQLFLRGVCFHIPLFDFPKSIEEAKSLYEKGAELKDMYCLNNLGYIYETDVKPKDSETSLRLYTEAMELGNSYSA